MVLKHHWSHPTTPAGAGWDTVIDASVPLHAEKGIGMRAELGDAEQLNLIVNDPDASYDFKVWHRWYMVEDEITDPDDQLVWNGSVGDQDIDHGESDDWEPWGRTWSLMLVEMNRQVDMRVITGTDGDRPAETAADRLTWLLGSDYLSTFHDNGLVEWDALTKSMDANSYLDQRPSAILNDIAKICGVNWYGYYDGTAVDGSRLSLAMFPFDYSTLNVNSGFKISNVDADIDDTDPDTQTTWPPEPIPGPRLHRAGDRVAAGVDVAFGDGRAYEYSYPTSYEYGFIDQVAPDATVKTAASAEALALRYLQDNSEQDQTVQNVRVWLPAARLNAVKHGQRIEGKFSHFRGLEGWGDGTAFVPCRVISKAFSRPDNEGQTVYPVDLELSPCRVLTGLHQVVLVSVGASEPLSQSIDNPGTYPFVFNGVGPGHPQSPMPPVAEDDDGWVTGGDVQWGDPGYTQVARAVCPAGMGGMYHFGMGGMTQTVWPPFPLIPYDTSLNGFPGGAGITTDASGSVQVAVLRNGVAILSGDWSFTGTPPVYVQPNFAVVTADVRIYDGDVITWQITKDFSSGGATMTNSFAPTPAGPSGVCWWTRTGD